MVPVAPRIQPRRGHALRRTRKEAAVLCWRRRSGPPCPLYSQVGRARLERAWEEALSAVSAEGLGLGSDEGEGLPFMPVGVPSLVERQGAQRGERITDLRATLHAPALLAADHTAIIGFHAQPTADGALLPPTGTVVGDPLRACGEVRAQRLHRLGIGCPRALGLQHPRSTGHVARPQPAEQALQHAHAQEGAILLLRSWHFLASGNGPTLPWAPPRDMRTLSRRSRALGDARNGIWT